MCASLFPHPLVVCINSGYSMLKVSDARKVSCIDSIGKYVVCECVGPDALCTYKNMRLLLVCLEILST